MPQLEMAVQTQAALYNPNLIIIEDKSAGTSVLQTLKQTTRLPLRAYDPGQRDKTSRATNATPTIFAGLCHIPVNAPWAEAFISEHEKFPNVDHDDQVDTTSCFVECLKAPVPKPRARYL
jgi:predicted phage terminase large subunit-like protein